MNSEQSNLEINSFINQYFKEAYDIIDFQMLFIESNALYQPHVNYHDMKKFIDTAINNFQLRDPKVLQGLLKKLYHDVQNLDTYLTTLLKNTASANAIFTNRFLTQSSNYQKSRENLTLAKKNKEIKKVKIYKAQIETLSDVYKDHFLQQFNRERTYITESLKYIISVKIYYVNKILWKKVHHSNILQKYFESANIECHFSLKSYINYRIKHFHTIQNNQLSLEYLQMCLHRLGEEDE